MARVFSQKFYSTFVGMARVFSQKFYSTFVGNVGINNIGTESVYQTRQAGRTEWLAGIFQEDLTREILARHSCLHLA